MNNNFLTCSCKVTCAQRWLIILSLFILFLLPWILGALWKLCDIGHFPQHRELSPEKYAERISIMKYAISLGFSIIGATWLLVSGKIGQTRLARENLIMLSWSWTFISIGLIASSIEVYLTYKDFYYWPLIEAEGNIPFYQEIRHCAYTHMLHFSYRMSLIPIFCGATTLIFSVTGILLVSPKDKDANQCVETTVTTPVDPVKAQGTADQP